MIYFAMSCQTISYCHNILSSNVANCQLVNFQTFDTLGCYTEPRIACLEIFIKAHQGQVMRGLE